jgi:hypothetical protein
MDLKSLIAKMTAIEEGAQMAPPSAPEVEVAECGDEMMPAAVEECGMDMMPHDAPKQQDNVTMNVSMNGSGAGGIRDLMDILRNLENSGGEEHGDELIIGTPGEGEIELPFADEDQGAGFGEVNTEPDPETANPEMMVRHGGDLASKGLGALKANGGENPMRVREALASKLAEMYEEIKNR